MFQKLMPMIGLAAAADTLNTLLTDVSTIDPNNYMSQIMTDVHNQWRADLANGVTYPGVYGTNIHKLTWADDIAEAAQAYANRCIYEHDYEGMRQMGVGENIGYRWFNKRWDNFSEAKLKYYFKELANAWPKEEYTFFNDNSTFQQNYPELYLNNPDNSVFKKKGSGHYTAMVRADTTEVGCGVSYCTTLIDEVKNGEVKYIRLGTGYEALYSVCRYRTGGNNADQFFERTFNANEIASACTGEVENGLCLANGATPNRHYKRSFNLLFYVNLPSFLTYLLSSFILRFFTKFIKFR